MLHKAHKRERRNQIQPLDLHKANCIICGATIQQTTSSNKDDAICYKCYQSMWGKQHSQANHLLKKAASN